MKTANPFPFSDNNRRFLTFDYYLRKRFGSKCYKVPLDAGFTCPNIDGTRGTGGCTYCVLPSKSRKPLPIREQFEANCLALEKKWSGAYRIAYFQDYSNTYADADRLRELYYEALSFPFVVGLSVATRADCLGEDVIPLLREIDKKTYLTVELGLQSSSDATAEKINRCHTYKEFTDACEALSGLNICVHIINGLPGEGRDEMLATARDVAALHPHEVKIHLLHILRGTEIEKEYLGGELSPMTLEDYAETVVDQLELLPPDVIIGRVTGDGLRDELTAPLWSLKKFNVMNSIDKLMVKRNTMQGAKYVLSGITD